MMLRLRVTPGARVPSLNYDLNVLHIKVTERAQDGKANAQVIRVIAEVTLRFDIMP